MTETILDFRLLAKVGWAMPTKLLMVGEAVVLHHSGGIAHPTRLLQKGLLQQV